MLSHIDLCFKKRHAALDETQPPSGDSWLAFTFCHHTWNNPCIPHNKTICVMIRLSTARGDYRNQQADILLMAVILFWGEFTLFEYNGKGCLHCVLSPRCRSVLTQSRLDSLAASWMDVLWQLIWVTIHLVHILLWDCLCNFLLKGSATLSSIC